MASQKQISCINAHVWSLEKWYRLTYLQGKNRDRHREGACVHSEERVGRIKRVAPSVHCVCEMGNLRETAVQRRELKFSIMCTNNLLLTCAMQGEKTVWDFFIKFQNLRQQGFF